MHFFCLQLVWHPLNLSLIGQCVFNLFFLFQFRTKPKNILKIFVCLSVSLNWEMCGLWPHLPWFGLAASLGPKKVVFDVSIYE